MARLSFEVVKSDFRDKGYTLNKLSTGYQVFKLGQSHRFANLTEATAWLSSKQISERTDNEILGDLWEAEIDALEDEQLEDDINDSDLVELNEIQEQLQKTDETQRVINHPIDAEKHIDGTLPEIKETKQYIDNRRPAFQFDDSEESAVLTDEQKYAEMDAFNAALDKEVIEKWNAYCDEVEAENKRIEAEDSELVAETLTILNGEDLEVEKVENAIGSGYLIDMFLVAFNVKLTATVIELYCYELSREIDKGNNFTPVNEFDKLGTEAMNLGFDANVTLYKPIYKYEDCVPGWWFDIVNYCIYAIQPILNTVLLEEIYSQSQDWFYDTEKHQVFDQNDYHKCHHAVV